MVIDVKPFQGWGTCRREIFIRRTSDIAFLPCIIQLDDNIRFVFPSIKSETSIA
jgi:hypothetical protein